MEFWSSGGLLQQIPTEMLREYEFNTLTVKHITVIPLSADAAVAHMYVEGGVQMKGLQPVPNYLTRSTLVMVLENGDWVTRAAHWSPIQGGAGQQHHELLTAEPRQLVSVPQHRLDAPRRLAGRLNGRQQQRDQDCDDRYHHEQFNQSKTGGLE